MRIIDQDNAPRKKHDRRLNGMSIAVTKFSITNFSKLLAQEMELENRDGVVIKIDDESNRIFIQKSDSEKAFVIKRYKESAPYHCSRNSFCNAIINHLKLKQKTPYRFSVEKVSFNNEVLFEIKLQLCKEKE